MATWTEVAMREIRDQLAGDKQEAMLALLRIDSALERSGEIIHRMKNFARQADPQATPVSLAKIFEEVSLLLEHKIRFSGTVLSVDIKDSLPPVKADKIQIQQVFMNLIMNALEAMENVEPSARHLDIRAAVAEGMLEVAVCDSGNSNPPDQLECIFEPFHSTKQEGLGLGLSICRSIIEWHGGRIWAARNAERGITVTFTLPLTTEKHRHATKTNHLHRR